MRPNQFKLEEIVSSIFNNLSNNNNTAKIDDWMRNRNRVIFLILIRIASVVSDEYKRFDSNALFSITSTATINLRRKTKSKRLRWRRGGEGEYADVPSKYQTCGVRQKRTSWQLQQAFFLNQRRDRRQVLG